jgi:hypothetical protein
MPLAHTTNIYESSRTSPWSDLPGLVVHLGHQHLRG